MAADTVVYAFVAFLASVAYRASAEASGFCEARDPAFVCGPVNAEDLVHLNGTSWVIASNLELDVTSGMPPTRYGFGPLEAIRIDTHAVRRLYPSSESSVSWDQQSYPDCAAPPRRMTSNGLNVRPLGGGRFRLYVVNHGNRESIEIIDVDAHAPALHATWRGCVLVPMGKLGIWPNSVAPLPGEGFIVSGFNVASWKPGRGWKKFSSYTGKKPGPPEKTAGHGMANGVEVSQDGRWVFIADTLRQSVIRVPLDEGRQRIIKLEFGPDNLRWGEDGRLYAAGSVWPNWKSPEDVSHCFQQPICVTGVVAISIDPNTLVVQTVVNDTKGLQGKFGSATTALYVGGQLWIGSMHADRIAILPMN